MGKRAVLVGCNYPGTEFELGGSVNDVKIVKEMLIDTYGFKEEHIRVFVDVKGVFKKNTIPTGKSIKRALKDLLKGSAKGDALVFHFSGHGGVIPSDDEGSSDGDNLQSFLLPTDYNILTSDDFKKILTKFPLTEGATFTVIADASQSDGLLEGHSEMINPPQPPRTLLRRIKEEAEEEAEEEAVVAAKSTGEATAATDGAPPVSNTVASETSAPAADESVDDKKAATVKLKEGAPTPVKEPAASAAKEVVPAVKEALPVPAAAAAKESATATAAVKQTSPAKESAGTASKKSATAVAKEGPAAGQAKSTGTASTKPAVSAKGAAAVSTKAGAAANAKHAAVAAPTRPAPTKPAAAAPAKADAAAPVTTVSKSLTVEVTEKPAPSTVPEPTANGTAEDSAPGATTKPGTEQESAEKAVVTEANESVEAEKEAGNENLTEVPLKVVGPQARQIALDSFLDALSQKAKKKAAKGSIRRSLHDAFGDSSSRTVKNYVQKLRRQKSSPIHRRGLSALMEIFACGGITETQHGKANQAAGKGPASVDSDESRTMDLGPHEEIEHIQSCVLLTAARRNQDVHDNGENGLFTDTLVKVVKKHKDDDSLESLSNYHLISCVADIMTNDMSIEQKPGLECSDINVSQPFILGRKQEEPKAAANGEAEDKKGEESAAESKQESSADTTKSAAAEATEEPKKEGDENSQKPELSSAIVKENGVAKEVKPAADKALKKTEAAASK